MTNHPREAAIGVFDSGIGGLSVLRHIHEQLPNESLIYFADAGFAPYGDRSEQEIMERTLVVARYLLAEGVKAIVVACNTATAAAIATLRAHYPELIIVGVEPGLKPAAALSQSGCAGVLATTATLASTKYQLLSTQVQQSTAVRFVQQACPGLVNRIELGELDSDETVALLKTYLHPILTSPADVLVLGCTHYPFLEPAIRRIVEAENGKLDQIIDTGIAIARQLQRLLTQQQLDRANSPTRVIHCATTGDASKLEFALTRLLKLTPELFTIREVGSNQVANSPQGH
jgi:glutamate racemase